MAYPRFQRARAHRFQKYTGGTITLGTTTTAFTILPSVSSHVLEAQVGDVLEYWINLAWENQNCEVVLDAVTIVSSAIVNHFGGGGSSGYGSYGWQAHPTATYQKASGPSQYTVVSGDIVNGQVTLGLAYRPVSAVARGILASAGVPLLHGAKNLGPQDPE